MTDTKGRFSDMSSTLNIQKKKAQPQTYGRFKDISAYFNKEEWAEMGDWEKIRYRNMKRNYETMLEIGLTVPRPAFMSHNRHHQKQMYNSSDSDEEWTPRSSIKSCRLSHKLDRFQGKEMKSLHLQQNMVKEPTMTAPEKNEEVQILFDSDAEENQKEFKGFTKETLTDATNAEEEAEMPRVCGWENITNQLIETELNGFSSEVPSEKNTQDSKSSGTYSLRKRERKIYAEINEIKDDDYLFCEECQELFVEECSIHGPPVFVEDTTVEPGQSNRSALTLPMGMNIRPSSIPQAGLGVWNEATTLPKGVHFGPYEGTITDEEEAANSGYSWVSDILIPFLASTRYLKRRSC
ncbi:probable histone-lysine N-methyltransferase PRDM7 [Rhinatrema bivittatum]|uniref:probable histone-lysine N-methyltransferase PRDM7 n=1 Tax=Rhinatrema bivittatum TaxID=194408 RepID=UPI00112684F0|nr:probable histone-lysine N-methyltransferase PRDM7 [Rhinatrema bivittatum]XP_029432926.1 probable histone-lysine N-methyltransferase PRDM7 [Rhinatrema bivittatum]